MHHSFLNGIEVKANLQGTAVLARHMVAEKGNPFDITLNNQGNGIEIKSFFSLGVSLA